MRRSIFVLPPLQELEELLRASLLEQAHEWTLDSLHLCARNFGDLAVAVYKTTSDLLELEVPRHIGVNENLGELARCDDEFGDEINGVITIAPKLGWCCLVCLELAVQLATSEEDQ